MDPIQISFFGATNSGKSTLVNAIAGQSVSLVSELPGTTTDPVRKRMELPGIGPCVLVDTAGYGDPGKLGARRERLTRAVVDSTDIAVLLVSGHPLDEKWLSFLQEADIPVVKVAAWHPGQEESHPEAASESILRRLVAVLPKEDKTFLTGRLVHEGSIVVLVMPQDSEAPKGRLILPQVQVLRELLDRGCVPVCCTLESLPQALKRLQDQPDLVITDSQVFKQVESLVPKTCSLTSFSILLAAAKGDIAVFVAGAKAMENLPGNARILVAEACTHVPDTEDIGRVKIPALLRRRIPGLKVDVAAGNDFPEDLSPYQLIIHCGACVASSRLVKVRIKKALRSGVPITNYGIAIAWLQGILDRVSLP